MFTDQPDKDDYSVETFQVTLDCVKLLVNVLFENLQCFKQRTTQNLIMIRELRMTYELSDVRPRYSFWYEVTKHLYTS